MFFPECPSAQVPDCACLVYLYFMSVFATSGCNWDVDNDSELLRRYALDGSQEAFRQLVALRLPLVYGAALRQLGDPHLAQDAAQAVFSDLARKAKSLAGRPVLASWLYTSTHFAVGNIARRERRIRMREHKAYLEQTSSEPEPEIDWTKARKLIDGELHSLGPGDQEAVILRFFEGNSFSDVGGAMGLSEEAARKRVERSLERLKASLESKGIASTASALAGFLANEAAGATPPGGLAGTISNAALSQVTTFGLGSTLMAMTTTKTGLMAAAVLAAAGVGSAVYENGQNQKLRAKTEALVASYSATQAMVKEVEARTTFAEQALTSLKLRERIAASAKTAKGSTHSTPTGGGSQQTLPRSQPVDQVQRGEEFLKRHPEVRDALIAQTDARNRALYGPLFASLKLTPDQVNQALEFMRSGIFTSPLQESGGVISLPVVDPSTLGEQEAKLKALLGVSGYQQYAAYGSPDIHQAAADLASMLADSPTPLSFDQGSEMTEILKSAYLNAPPWGFDWASVTANAQAVLTPPQMEALQAMATHATGWQQVMKGAQ